MTERKILITGASGFTGRYIIEAASNAGYHCATIAQQADQVSNTHESLIADLLNVDALGLAIRQANPGFIIHLAGISFVAHGNTAEIYKVNQLGTINLLEAIRKHAPDIQKIIVASSANIYGNAVNLPINESTPAQPVNHYGVSKYAMELAARLYTDLPITITRPFNYTGHGQNPDFLIPKIVNAFKAKQKTIELGNLDVSRDFSDVRDVAAAYVRLLEVSSQEKIFNICSGQATSLLSIVEMLNTMAGYKISVSINPDFARADEIKTLYGSPALLETAIGNYRQYAVHDSLEAMFRS